MAGMLPGVEVARRRKANHSSSDILLGPPRFSLTSTFSSSSSSSSSLDETTLKARTRLEEKLGKGVGSRWGKHQSRKDRQADHQTVSDKKSTEKMMGMMTVEKARGSDRKIKTAEKEICAVCLEEITTKQIITSLPCFHKYHYDCLLPWLNAHSQCPYCRTHVPF
ncbi:hypothetical protein ACLOJK_033582 [Asimina triloba]